MSQDFNTTKYIKKQSSLKKLKERSTSKLTNRLSDKVCLEKVLGLTVKCSSHIVVHEPTHQCAYLAGSVVVILNSKTNRQTHIVNTCRKTLSSVDFLYDGSHIATGEAGHQPAVRVWNIEPNAVSEHGCGVQVAELHGHSFGIPIVAFAPHSSMLVSVGNQHDQEINVWNWRSGLKVASNKVSAKVQTVSFSEDGKWFVTCGVRHVRFWYIEKSSKNLNVEPLKGKAALLGEKKTLSFCDVSTGKGLKNGSCFTVAKEGILCEFNAKRNLTKWVDLSTSAAYSLAVGKKYIYCGCANGSIRVFEVLSLDYLATFPKPHFLGVQVAACTDPTHLTDHPEDARYPDCVAVQLDESNQKLYACYSDHSLYIWDVFNLYRIGKYSSFLFHSAPVRDVKMYPELEVPGPLPPGSFLTCSNDNTLRVWNLYPHINLSGTTYEPNVYSNELLDIVYIDTDHLMDIDASKHQQDRGGFPLNSVNSGSYAVLPTDNVQQDDKKAGFRCMALTDSGTHIAAGDRMGNVRIYDAAMLHKGELLTLEAHDSEVLSLEYSASYIEPPMLATASRDRVLHVLSVDQNYDLVRTLTDHSSSITGVKIHELRNGTIQLVSGGMDKSLVFRNVTIGNGGNVQLTREHIVAEKTTFYDLTLDTEQNLYATACQDRNIRFYDSETSKHVRTIKGSEAEDGNINRLCLDPTQTFIATCGSDKTISLIDKQSGDIVTTVFGHSETITGLAFTNDSKRLISTCGDSCVFVWKLSRQMTQHLNQVPIPDEFSHRSLSSAPPAEFRTRARSESVKPAINKAILLDDDDSELPSWFKKSNPSKMKRGGPANPMSASLGGLNAVGEDHLSMPGGRWGDRANEQFSLATSVNVASCGEEFSMCDPHQLFTENLAVKRYNSGSESNASICSSTNLAEEKVNSENLNLASPLSRQFDIEDIEISSPDPENEANTTDLVEPRKLSQIKEVLAPSERPSDLKFPAMSPTKKSDKQTPSVDTQPVPIFMAATGAKEDEKGKGSYKDDVEGFKVNISNTDRLSPDSVDKDQTTSEDQDSISESEGPPGRRFKVKSSTSRSNLDKSGASRRTVVAARSSTELDAEAATDEEDENMEAGGDADQDSINDGDAEEDDNVEDVKPELAAPVELRRNRRNSLTNQHFNRMTNHQGKSAKNPPKMKLVHRLRHLMKPTPLLNSKKTLEELRQDETGKDFSLVTQSESVETTVATDDHHSVNPSHPSDVASGDRVAPKKFARTHLTPGNNKLISSQSMSRPQALHMSLDGTESSGSKLKSTSSMRAADPASLKSPVLSDTRRSSKNLKHHSEKSGDLSSETTNLSHNSSVKMKRRGAMLDPNRGSHVNEKNPAADKGQEQESKATNIRRFKSDVGQKRRGSDNNLTKRQTGGSSTTLSANQGKQTNSVTTTSSATTTNTAVTTSNNAPRTLSNASTTSTTSEVSLSKAPSYLKATRSSNLKTANSSLANSRSGSNTTLHKSGLSGSNTVADLSEDSLDERSSASYAPSQKPKRTSKAPLHKYASSRGAEKKKIKSWRSADSLFQETALALPGSRKETLVGGDHLTEVEETQLASPHGSKHSGNFLTPTNPMDLNGASSTAGKTYASAGTTAPCLFCIRKETGVDDDEGFVSNEYKQERCVCLPEQVLRMRPPKNTDPGLSDSDLEDSDNRSGSDYCVSQQDLNLAGCQRAVNRLNHSFKVVSGYHQQAEDSEEKDEIVQLLRDTCSQISHTMLSNGMIPSGTYQQLAEHDLQQLKNKFNFPSPNNTASRNLLSGSSVTDNAAVMNLLQHYSGMLVNIFQQQLSNTDLTQTGSSSDTTSISATVSYNDMQNTQDDFPSEGTNDDSEQPASISLSHAASNETLEEI